MTNILTPQQTVIRTERGLTIAGTRITLYSIMDHLKADWPPTLIKHWFDLSNTQIADVMEYITTHRDEVEAEYQEVLQYADQIRAYWEERNKGLRERIATLPPKPGQEKLYAKLKARKAALGIE